MAIDIARISYDPGRHYTGVVAQQGRVSLEAEHNEGLAIDQAERRAELVDIIGPCGTPDDGYAVTQGSGYDIVIGPGTMYVGGTRLTLTGELDYNSQPDWLDNLSDPDNLWLPVPQQAPTVNEWVVLVVTERDVTAVEDGALKEVALGGPDGSGRLRLVQHVVRLPTQATTCSDAMRQQTKAWIEDQGLYYYYATAELRPASRMQVKFPGRTSPTQPCDPTALGGYLGADNQAFRVQVSSVDPDSGNVSLLWGPDDASMLYRVSSDGQTPPTLTFSNTPVDSYHQPAAGQAVEVLVDAAELASVDGQIEGYLSSLSGQPAILSSSYEPSNKTLALPEAIYIPGAADAKQLYLRAWQGYIQNKALGTWIELPGTGIQVSITAQGYAPVHPGDYWVIAARPSTPTEIYPARLGRGPQPPDGPRMWACPLALVGWSNGTMEVLDDCRQQFPPLTSITNQGGGCCTVSVTLEQGQGNKLQGLVDKYTADAKGSPVTICLQPGRYVLDAPLRLRRGQSKLRIEGCGGWAVLAPARTEDIAFADGLVLASEVAAVTFERIAFDLPLVGRLSRLMEDPNWSDLDRAALALYSRFWTGIGLHLVQCEGVSVLDCRFYFRGAPEGWSIQAGIFGQGNIADLVIKGSVFEGARAATATTVKARQVDASLAPQATSETAALPARLELSAGYIGSPTLLQLTGAGAGAGTTSVPSLVRAALEAQVAGNTFQDLTFSFLATGALGRVEVSDNIVRSCGTGFLFVNEAALAAATYLGALRYDAAASSAAKFFDSSDLSPVLAPEVFLATMAARCVPLPESYSASKRSQTQQRKLAHSGEEQNAGTLEFARGFAGSVAADFSNASDQELSAIREGLRYPLSSFNQANAIDPVLMAMTLHVHGNDIDCRGIEAMTAPALTVWYVAPATSQSTSQSTSQGPTQVAGAPASAATPIPNGAVLVESNRMSSRAAFTASLLGPLSACVTGNVITNVGTGLSLAIRGKLGHAAVTGNVLYGQPALPARPNQAAPLDTWLPFNEVI
ncbi:MAG TPA: DUF6519 domain-containing protein [Acidimicrobiales bacterium]|nr:DUF6519 domain-containing protein [Acidimicrobiales bacterium]